MKSTAEWRNSTNPAYTAQLPPSLLAYSNQPGKAKPGYFGKPLMPIPPSGVGAFLMNEDAKRTKCATSYSIGDHQLTKYIFISHRWWHHPPNRPANAYDWGGPDYVDGPNANKKHKLICLGVEEL